MAKDSATPLSRRTLLQAGLLVAVTGFSRQTSAQAKIAQNLVQYQQTPKGDQECDKCLQFQPPNACKVVEGTINPKGWCAAYAPKS
jgi:High potential iron-sulfur protein